VTEPEADERPVAAEQSPPEPPPDPPRRRLRALPALALASILVAGGLLMAVGGMARILGPALPTPTPRIAPTPVPTLDPGVPLGPSPSPYGEHTSQTAPV
jgi:hypothetical protein